MRPVCHEERSDMMISNETTINNYDLELQMSNNTEDRRESQ